MTAAFIEHRPKSTDPFKTVSHFVIVADGKDVGIFKMQKIAQHKACADGYSPVHVARHRHLQDRTNPDHYRHDQH